MATATQVTIRVVVDGKDAGPAIDGINAKLGEIGVKGSASARQAGNAMDQLGHHAATPLDAVRLLSQEFGLRLPRAIEAMLSRMPAVTGAISGVVGGLAAIAGIEVFAHLAMEAKRLYDEFISLNSVIDKYNESIEKAREADLPNARTLETAQLRLRDQTLIAAREGDNATSSHESATGDSSKAAQIAAALAPAGGAGALIGGAYYGIKAGVEGYEGHTDEEKATKAAAARDELAHRTRIELLHEQTLAQIELNHAQDAALTGAQKINAETLKKKQLTDENNRFKNSMDKAAGNEVAPGAGATEVRTKDAIADAEAAAQITLQNREMNLAIMKSNDARIQAGLQGEELYKEKMLADIREIRQELANEGKSAEFPARQREIQAKYLEDASQRFVQSRNEQGGRQREAAASGLTGAARIYAEQDIEVNRNNEKYTGEERAQANIAAAQAANQKLLDLQRQFTQEMDSIDEGRIGSTLNGYQRIDAEATKTADHIREAFEKSYGGQGVDQNSADYVAAAKKKEDALAANEKAAAEQRQQLRNQMDEETLRYDQQAAEAERRVRKQGLLGWTTDYTAALGEIRAQEDARERDLKNQLDKGDVDWQNYNRRLEDVHAEATAQIASQNQQMQHEVASQLQQAFTDPLQFIKSKMEQMFFEVIASWLLQLKLFKGMFGQTMGGLQIGGTQSAGQGGILGSLGSAVRGTFGGRPTAPSAGNAQTSIGSVIPGSGGMVMTPAGPAPSLDTGGSIGSTGLAVPAAADRTGIASPAASADRSSSASGSASTAGVVVSSISQADSLAGMVHSNFVAATQPAQSDGAIAAMPSVAGGGPDITPTHNPQPTLPSSSGSQGQSGAAGGFSKAQGAVAVGMAGYEGYNATKEAYMSDSVGGTFKGAAQDAMAGAAIGMVVGGPMGALVGAAIGAGVGLASGIFGMITGEGPRLKAREYYRNTLFPEIEAERNSDGTDYQTAISNVNRIASDGMSYMAQHFGRSAAQWVDDNYLKKEQNLADAQIEARAKGGSYAVAMSAPQFHTGGRITGFGDLATGYREGFIHAELGEGVVRGSAMAAHGPYVDAMNSGASPADVAKMYLAQSPPSSSGTASAQGKGHTFVIQALDSKSFDSYMKSGGAKITQRHLNNLADNYAGDAAHG